MVQVIGGSVKLTSSGSVCVHVRAGSTINPGPEPTCTTSTTPPSPGRGSSKPKFFMVGTTVESNSESLAKQVSTNAGGATTQSSGLAEWSGIYFPAFPFTFLGATRRVSAKVTTSDPQATNRGRAAGEARDPLEFSAVAASNLAYTVTLSDLSIKADSIRARNRVQVVATFENVRRNGTPVTGALWTLTIASTGVVTSNATLTVDLSFWPGLQITPAQEAAAEAALRAHLQPLGNGYIGFEGEIELIGEDAPVPEIVLDHPANQTIRYADTVSVDTEIGQSAPVPSLLPGAAAVLMLLLAAVGLTLVSKSRRTVTT